MVYPANTVPGTSVTIASRYPFGRERIVGLLPRP
jgi:hypothetical protein